MGTFKAHDGEYFLEPLLPVDGGEPDDTHNKPHLIYRREATRAPAPSHGACGVSGACCGDGTLRGLSVCLDCG